MKNLNKSINFMWYLNFLRVKIDRFSFKLRHVILEYKLYDQYFLRVKMSTVWTIKQTIFGFNYIKILIFRKNYKF